MGWPGDIDCPETYLLSQSKWIATYVARHGCLLEQWGVDAKVIALLKNLHARSWFSYGDIDSAVAVRVGGRQGCKCGAMNFQQLLCCRLEHDA